MQNTATAPEARAHTITLNDRKRLGITRVEDATGFDPMFVEAFALRLAAELAVPLAASDSLRDSLIKEYRQFVQQAKTESAMEGVQDVFVKPFAALLQLHEQVGNEQNRYTQRAVLQRVQRAVKNHVRQREYLHSSIHCFVS